MYKVLKYDDLCLYILKVPKYFPNGFFIQPMKKHQETKINGARYADSMVEQWNIEITNLLDSSRHEELY